MNVSEEIPMTLRRMICANGETAEWNLVLGKQVGDPIWRHKDTPLVELLAAFHQQHEREMNNGRK